MEESVGRKSFESFEADPRSANFFLNQNYDRDDDAVAAVAQSVKCLGLRSLKRGATELT